LLITLTVSNSAHKLTNRHSPHCTEVMEVYFIDTVQLKL